MCQLAVKVSPDIDENQVLMKSTELFLKHDNVKSSYSFKYDQIAT